jgi:hypothetical protein
MWVTGGNAELMVSRATTEARATPPAAICADRFAKDPDMEAKLASLKGRILETGSVHRGEAGQHVRVVAGI